VSHPQDQGGCSAAALEGDLNSVRQACTDLLQRPGLTDAARSKAYVIRGRASTGLSQFDSAISDYEIAIALAPRDPEPRARRGRAAFFKGDLELALKHAEDALALDGAHAPAYGVVGMVMRRKGNWPRANIALQQAIRLRPDEPSYQYERFQVLLSWDRPTDALQQADRILRMPARAITKPDAVLFKDVPTSYRIAVRLDRARLLHFNGRASEAETALNELVRDDPSGFTYAWRANYRHQEDAPEHLVRADLEEALARDPNYWFAHHTLGRVHFYAKRHAQAEAAFGSAKSLKSNSGQPRWWRAMALRELGRLQEAVEEAASVVDVDIGYLHNKLETLQERGYLPRAIDEAPEAMLRDAARACIVDPECW
jgi:tetratricopeptide (TPR) repeat protein